ncbi:PssD/Cps14F family polysaccharide biosynthesis glycosyltransferase [Bifidobacterium eulemuris]|uniref:Polysaccharide biosynthesis protein n=1 Tax=Bifidobacterium eulemuris TaxID=1765219 RepID=A0A261GBC5_9BIFI|nr:PssD/Cps14F family polysaccharide biosynthesis glycosyltransferase [Bifidobacterium eulemuris]OZG68543.1 polysaccharide biosynthesis protein [Bifidobacterium eulemuris]QOL32673.1 polysaccharide biosynthesis protein [Bifidobacterium eulemuris]
MKICFVSSSGGHWEELCCLSGIAKKNDAFFVTETCEQAIDSQTRRIYTVPQINRHEKGFIKHFFQLVATAYKMLTQECPDVIISTGALVAFPFCLIGKLCGCKIIYIESFARVKDKSLTGKLVYPFADLFLVQWRELLPIYPKSVYVGPIF